MKQEMHPTANCYSPYGSKAGINISYHSPGRGGVCLSFLSATDSSTDLEREVSSAFFTGVETAPGFAILSSSLLRRLNRGGGVRVQRTQQKHH